MYLSKYARGVMVVARFSSLPAVRGASKLGCCWVSGCSFRRRDSYEAVVSGIMHLNSKYYSSRAFNLDYFFNRFQITVRY